MFRFVFVGPNFPETFFNKSEWIAKTFGNFPPKSENWKILEVLRQTIQRRILTASVYYSNTSRMKKIFENLGKPVRFSLFFYYHKFQKTEKTTISFFSWNFGIIYTEREYYVVAAVVIERTILKIFSCLVRAMQRSTVTSVKVLFFLAKTLLFVCYSISHCLHALKLTEKGSYFSTAGITSP